MSDRGLDYVRGVYADNYECAREDLMTEGFIVCRAARRAMYRMAFGARSEMWLLDRLDGDGNADQ